MPVTRRSCGIAGLRVEGVVCFVVAAAVVTVLFLASLRDAAPTGASDAGVTATISGFAFHDLDRDGIRDGGEPGLSRRVQLVQDGNLIGEDDSGGDGTYSIEGVPPGDYELVTELDGAISFCVDPALPSFDPLVVAGCVGYIDQPWHPTTPERYAVSVAGTEAVRRDFGATPFDQSVLLGLAILEGDYTPPGTAIEASVNGQVCGTTAVADQPFSGTHYRIVVVGAGEQPGCATEGEPLTMRVGGVEASETPHYLPQVNQPNPVDFIQNLVAMPNHAWYWAQQGVDELPGVGTVQALVDGTVCGETSLVTQSALGQPLATGFFRLIVPAEALQAGCGRPGATVSFTIDGAASETVAQWAPGVQRLTLDLPAGTASPTPSPAPSGEPSPSPAALPSAGGDPASADPWSQFAVTSAIPLLLTCGGCMILARRHTMMKSQGFNRTNG